MTDPLHTWTARRLARAMAARELRAATLAEALIERSAALDPELHVWAAFDAARMRQAAQASDRARASSALQPLRGLPVAVKDIIDVAGWPTAYGSPIYAGHVSQVDAACVALVRSAGAYVMGKSVTTELANFTPANTRHPLKKGHTPGGSSSGSAAAVAAGIVPLALGTQTAGSVIRPAAYCGVVGYKPSPGCIPRAGVKLNADTLDEVGVLARNVGDAALLAQALAGLTLTWDLHTGELSTRQAPSIGVTLTSRASVACKATHTMIDRAAKQLANAGASVHEAAWPASFDALFDAQRTVQAFETARALAPEWHYRRHQLSKPLAAFIEEGQGIEAGIYVRALATARRARQGLDALFGHADVLITPAAPSAAPQGLLSTGDPVFNRPWQLLGCPCITIPVASTADGLPLGLQVVARPQDDARLFAVAAWMQACSWDQLTPIRSHGL
jgi:Asp-tRNA(Asn)/Glu-tRNA(Gln) amidotransferase A subunit family amidase